MQACEDTLPNPLPLELRQCRQDVELEFACRGCAVDALTQTDERHADMLEVFEHRHEMPQVASEAIQPPAHEHVEASTLGVFQQGIEGRSSVLRTADASIYVFNSLPATSSQ